MTNIEVVDQKVAPEVQDKLEKALSESRLDKVDMIDLAIGGPSDKEWIE